MSGIRIQIKVEQQGVHRLYEKTVVKDFVEIIDCENMLISRYCKRRDILREIHVIILHVENKLYRKLCGKN